MASSASFINAQAPGTQPGAFTVTVRLMRANMREYTMPKAKDRTFLTVKEIQMYNKGDQVEVLRTGSRTYASTWKKGTVIESTPNVTVVSVDYGNNQILKYKIKSQDVDIYIRRVSY